jgi:hypothetical protein
MQDRGSGFPRRPLLGDSVNSRLIVGSQRSFVYILVMAVIMEALALFVTGSGPTTSLILESLALVKSGAPMRVLARQMR